MFRRHIDFTSQSAFGKRAAAFIPQRLSDAAELIYKASDPRICRAHHRAARFHASKNRVRQMLVRSGRMQKPSVVCNIDKQICAGIRLCGEHKLSDELADRIFETNQRGDLHIAVRQAEHRVFSSRTEIAGYLVANDSRKQRNRMPPRNVFAKRNQVDFSIHLPIRRRRK